MPEQEYLSANQVLELFCATMLKQETYNFSREKLMEVIHDFKLDNKYIVLLHDIKYTNKYSRDLEKSIMLFKIYGIIFNKGVDSMDKLSISEFLDYNKVLERFSKYSKLMEEIVDKYLECEKVYAKHT